MPLLRLKLPDQSEITHELTAHRVTIGRRPDNLIQIVDPSVSAHHAEFIIAGGHYRLHDLGSTNLTFVEGSPITDFHLLEPCRIAFGTVQCVFDPYTGGRAEPQLSSAQMEKDLAFLRGENADLQGKLTAMERQIDILSSARLVTKRSEVTPFSAMNDTVRAITSERDDLRHLAAGLKLELEKLREELLETIRERDTARQSLELLHAEKVVHGRELQALRKQTTATAAEALPASLTTAGLTVIEETQPPRRPVPARARSGTPLTVPATSAENAATQRITLPLPIKFQGIATALVPVRDALANLTAQPADTQTLARLSTFANELVASAAQLGDHPISRLGLAIEGLLQDFASRSESPAAAHLRTLADATDLIANLLEPQHLDSARNLPHPKVLAVDDDAELLQTLTASLELAHLPTTACADSQAARALLEKDEYDLLLLDVNMPGLDGPALCGQLRDSQRHRNTPVIFLTMASALDRHAEASLSGGNDFLPKPFNAAELTVKAETWIWKNRFGLL